MKKLLLISFVILVISTCKKDDSDFQIPFVRSFPSYRPTQMTLYYNGELRSLKKFKYNVDNQLTEIEICDHVTKGNTLQSCYTEKISYLSDGRIIRTDEYGYSELSIESLLPIKYSRDTDNHSSWTTLITKSGYIVKVEERSTWIDPLGGITTYSSLNKDTLIYSFDGKLMKIDYATWFSSRLTQDYSDYSKKWTFQYDGIKLVEIDGPVGPLATYQYNNEGLISIITNGQNIINFEYDEFGNCVKQRWESLDVASEYEMTITYEKATSNALYIWYSGTYQIIKSYEIFKLPPFSLLDYI